MNHSNPKRPKQVATHTTRYAIGYGIFVLVLLLCSWGIVIGFVLSLTVPTGVIRAFERLTAVSQTSLTLFVYGGTTSFAFFVLISSVILSVGAWAQFQTARELEQSGSIVQGTIVDKWIEVIEGSKLYSVTYRFGSNWEARTTIKPSAYEKLRVGDAVMVRFLPREPKISRPEWDWERKT